LSRTGISFPSGGGVRLWPSSPYQLLSNIPKETQTNCKGSTKKKKKRKEKKKRKKRKWSYLWIHVHIQRCTNPVSNHRGWKTGKLA